MVTARSDSSSFFSEKTDDVGLAGRDVLVVDVPIQASKPSGSTSARL
ncbi:MULTISPECIES: hypothetical protein [Mycobacteriaceae]|nr:MULTISPECIES: hypothetical protein [Mycobacteriaceae]